MEGLVQEPHFICGCREDERWGPAAQSQGGNHGQQRLQRQESACTKESEIIGDSPGEFPGKQTFYAVYTEHAT